MMCCVAMLRRCLILHGKHDGERRNPQRNLCKLPRRRMSFNLRPYPVASSYFTEFLPGRAFLLDCRSPWRRRFSLCGTIFRTSVKCSVCPLRILEPESTAPFGCLYRNGAASALLRCCPSYETLAARSLP